MTNLEIARLFNEIADLLEIKDENVFKVRAYRRAAMNLESLTEEIGAVAARGGLLEIAGVGKDLAAKIQEAIDSGRIDYLEGLRKEIPRGVVELMAIPGVGPKTAKLLYDKLQVDSVDTLEA
ncbi:MAG: helix-hairpin-helix domain-containing protein, partial [Candidatus Methylomirabilaceae bacterium]